MQNDLDNYVLGLLKFVEDSVKEALNDPASQQALLSEADDAMRVLQRTLVREDKIKLTQLLLLGVFDHGLQSVANENPQALSRSVSDALQIKMRAKDIFQS